MQDKISKKNKTAIIPRTHDAPAALHKGNFNKEFCNSKRWNSYFCDI